MLSIYLSVVSGCFLVSMLSISNCQTANICQLFHKRDTFIFPLSYSHVSTNTDSRPGPLPNTPAKLPGDDNAKRHITLSHSSPTLLPTCFLITVRRLLNEEGLGANSGHRVFPGSDPQKPLRYLRVCSLEENLRTGAQVVSVCGVSKGEENHAAMPMGERSKVR